MPCDMSLYPKEWPQIRARILERAGNRCEVCGVANHAHGYRDSDGAFHELASDKLFYDGHIPDGAKIIRIVLTIAHWDNPDPMDCRDENLKATCQKCHNSHDMPMRKKNARQTLLSKKAAGSLFELVD
jgi:hypothetical protein